MKQTDDPNFDWKRAIASSKDQSTEASKNLAIMFCTYGTLLPTQGEQS